jgi:tetratricopeptide (TPR) repeat protein
MQLLCFFVFVALAAAQLTPPSGLTPIDQLKIPENKETYANADQPQVLNLAGVSLFGLKDDKGEIAAARAQSEKEPDNPRLLIDLGLLQDSYMRHSDAIATYSDGVAKFPKDWRFLRYRGQRWISLRKFANAIEDLEKARAVTKQSYDVAYYLGLAYYLSGEYEKADAEFGRCEAQLKEPLSPPEDLMGMTSCEVGREDRAFLVPLKFWRYLALRRGGKTAEAKAYAEAVSPLWSLRSNKAFYDALLYFRGNKDVLEMLDGANEATRDYLIRSAGVAVQFFTEGERQRACSIWQRNSMDSKWNHLGVIAAEAEYYLTAKAACALYSSAQSKP